MNHFKFVSLICTSKLLFLSVALSLVIGFAPAVMAGKPPPIVSTTESESNTVTKSYDFGGWNKKSEGALGYARTHFEFHPPSAPDKYTVILKNYKDMEVNNQVFGGGTSHWAGGTFFHEYSCEPAGHKKVSTGDAEYSFVLKANKEKNKDPNKARIINYNIAATMKATIDPGEREKPPEGKVWMTCTVGDPVTFSDLDPDATFFFDPNGADHQFSLLDGTSFPQTEFDSDNTYMLFESRLASGSIGDPETFWDDSLPNCIDLYSLLITSDENYNINVDLAFGASTSLFTLDFRDSGGVAFDPTNPLAIETIEEQIRDAFANGAVTEDLTNVFTVGFVPTALVTEYTLGDYDKNQLSGPEPAAIPEPATLVLMLTGLGLFVRRRR
jgi:hypothetical protein